MVIILLPILKVHCLDFLILIPDSYINIAHISSVQSPFPCHLHLCARVCQLMWFEPIILNPRHSNLLQDSQVKQAKLGHINDTQI